MVVFKYSVFSAFSLQVELKAKLVFVWPTHDFLPP